MFLTYLFIFNNFLWILLNKILLIFEITCLSSCAYIHLVIKMNDTPSHLFLISWDINSCSCVCHNCSKVEKHDINEMLPSVACLNHNGWAYVLDCHISNSYLDFIHWKWFYEVIVNNYKSIFYKIRLRCE